MPGFLKALDELVTLYEKQDEFRAKSFQKAKESLEGQRAWIGANKARITSVDDIKLFKLSELDGVGKGTLECLKEFIETGKIQRLEELRQKVSEEAVDYIAFWDAAETDLRKALTLLPEKDSVSVSIDGKLLLNGNDKECYVCQGCPFTFEYEGDTYKVVGRVDEDILEDNGRRLSLGITFTGNITKKSGEPVDFDAESEVARPEYKLGTPSINCDTKALGLTEDKEEDFLETLGENLLDGVFNNYEIYR